MTAAGTALQRHPTDVPNRPDGGHRRAASMIPFLAMSGVWLVVTFHAWHLRSIVTAYEADHGPARLPGSGQRPDHLQVFHDDLMAVGADYFYPFGPGMVIVVGVLWVGALALTRTGIGGFRRGVGGLGLVALVTQLVLFAGALETYVHITD